MTRGREEEGGRGYEDEEEDEEDKEDEDEKEEEGGGRRRKKRRKEEGKEEEKDDDVFSPAVTTKIPVGPRRWRSVRHHAAANGWHQDRPLRRTITGKLSHSVINSLNV